MSRSVGWSPLPESEQRLLKIALPALLWTYMEILVLHLLTSHCLFKDNFCLKLSVSLCTKYPISSAQVNQFPSTCTCMSDFKV